MRLMWERFGRPVKPYAVRRPYTLADLERTLGEYAGDAVFARDFFARYVQGRDVPDYASLLNQADFLVRPAQSPGVGGTAVARRGLDRHDGDRATIAGITVRGQPRSRRPPRLGRRSADRRTGGWSGPARRAGAGDSIQLVFL